MVKRTLTGLPFCLPGVHRAIGNIYCITISAVQHRKLKLKKDVFGESNPDVTLEQILKRIEN